MIRAIWAPVLKRMALTLLLLGITLLIAGVMVPGRPGEHLCIGAAVSFAAFSWLTSYANRNDNDGIGRP